ncbi:MAG: PilT/PilU family type 4a pilus ATPase [Lentisphaeraceae bacterium]|nr:PilT/PilU family type 4a pilus ATPase [Lentisphaeraceae bacterium]
MNNEIDWLCYLGVQNGIYTVDQVKALYDISPEGTSMMDFAQGTLDNGFTDDVTNLQVILEQAVNFANEQGPCPQSILGVPSAAPAPVDDEPYAIDDEPYDIDESMEDSPDDVVPQSTGPDAPRKKIAFNPGTPTAEIDIGPTATPLGAAAIQAALAPAPGQGAPAPVAQPAAAPVAAPATADGFQHVSTSHTYPFDISGFPDLSQAEGNPSKASELMKEFLRYSRSVQASDVHISSATFPHIRRFAKNYLIDNQPVLSVEAAKILNMALASSEQVDKFNENLELDYSADFGNGERYRVNVMRHFRGYEGSYRVITDKIKTLKELGFAQAEVLEKLTTYHQGLVLVTGPAGCGKTTTLASMVELINKNREDHIITVEDPVEILIESKGCNVSQRELNTSTKSFANALRAALREDPDIIVIGEMRDLETIEMAISAAETGHLVIGTLHTSSASATLDRVLDVFPPSQQAQIRAMLAESLKGIVCQRLIPNKDGSKLLMAPEVLIGTLAVGNLIKDGNTYQLSSVIETGGKKGMISSEDSMINLYNAGEITIEQARPYVRTNAKMRQLEAMENAGGAAAYAQQQQMAAENPDQGKKKGWFK